MEHHQPSWGRPRDDVYGPYAHSFHASDKHSTSMMEPVSHTTQPSVTGSSVLGVKFQGGVVLAADNLASYGSMRRFTDQKRITHVGTNTIVGMGGDVADLQALEETLEKLQIDHNYDYNETLAAPNVHSYLQHLMYQRRSKMNPLWNSVLVGGFNKNKEPYLAYVDLLGVSYQAPALATGYGAYLAIPILRKLVDTDEDVAGVTEAQARRAVAEGMKVLFYRDGRAMDKYTLAVVTKDGVTIDDEVPVTDQSWDFAKDIRGFGNLP